MCFMANAHAVVCAVKTRTDPQPLTQPTKTHTQIGMLKALAQLRQGHHRNELAGRNANDLSHHDPNQRMQQVVQHMVAVVGPLRHLTLRMMHRMQGPPGVELMLRAMQPIVDEVKHNEINDEADQRAIRHTEPQIF